jgi:hypothetical protein
MQYALQAEQVFITYQPAWRNLSRMETVVKETLNSQ